MAYIHLLYKRNASLLLLRVFITFGTIFTTDKKVLILSMLMCTIGKCIGLYTKLTVGHEDIGMFSLFISL